MPPNDIHEPVSAFDAQGRYIGEHIGAGMEADVAAPAAPVDTEVGAMMMYERGGKY